MLIIRFFFARHIHYYYCIWCEHSNKSDRDKRLSILNTWENKCKRDGYMEAHTLHKRRDRTIEWESEKIKTNKFIELDNQIIIKTLHTFHFVHNMCVYILQFYMHAVNLYPHLLVCCITIFHSHNTAAFKWIELHEKSMIFLSTFEKHLLSFGNYGRTQQKSHTWDWFYFVSVT